MDLPENVTMSPFSDQAYLGRQGQDRSIDMESTSYRQMNPHQNPYTNSSPLVDSIPLPEYNGRGHLPPPPMPPIEDYDQGPLGNSHQLSLPPKDIPLDMSQFRDESAKPNYVPPLQNSREDYVQEQETRIRDNRESEETKKAISQKFDIIAQLQMPIVVAILFWIFQIEKINRLMAHYLNFLGLFREDGTLNVLGITAKSVVFGGVYYSIQFAMDLID